jgi:transcription elongation factor Elf1
MKEQFFQCPYCWEQISMLIDTSVQQQTYVEDCEVCCNPIELEIITQSAEVISITANPLEY